MLQEGIKRLIGVDTKDFANVLSESEVRHIVGRHGKIGKADHSKPVYDMARMGYIIKNFDLLEEGKGAKAYKNSDGTNAKTIIIKKKIGEREFEIIEGWQAQIVGNWGLYRNTQKKKVFIMWLCLMALADTSKTNMNSHFLKTVYKIKKKLSRLVIKKVIIIQKNFDIHWKSQYQRKILWLKMNIFRKWLNT